MTKPVRVTVKQSERGQAMIETLLLSWILILFFAATFQIFLVNESIYRSLVAVHQLLFEQAFENNCSDHDDEKCRYTSHNRNRVIWRSQDVPEIEIPVVGMFESYGLSSPLRLTSNSPLHEDTFKRTKLAAGTYYPIEPCDHPGASNCLAAEP